MARRFGSAMMAKAESIRRIYTTRYIPVKLYTGVAMRVAAVSRCTLAGEESADGLDPNAVDG